MSKISYRPEIDGLRAIAVMAVMLYHAGFVLADARVLPGGFLGVDVFFVISGYLITGIIWQQRQAGEFSLRQFYERRARRILPALFLVMAVSTPFAHGLMAAKELREFAGSGLASLGFVSNVWFWLEDPYTAAPSAFKPLLHTWSLSVEEQFYVFFPWALALLWWLGRRLGAGVIAAVTVVAALCSLLLAHYGSAHFANAAFFMLPTRMWELLGGAMLVLIPAERWPVSLSARGHAVLTLAGLLLMGAAFVLFDDRMRHPSLVTVLPVAGAMLVIACGNRPSVVSRALANPVLVAIGLCSYSLYLWHFPVLALGRVAHLADTGYAKAGLLALSAALAVAAFHLVEQPLRNRTLVGSRQFTVGMLAGGIVLIVTFILLFRASALQLRSFRLDGELFDIDAEKTKRFTHEERTCGWWGLLRCTSSGTSAGHPRILVVGDSLVPDVVNSIGTLYPTHDFWLSTWGGCPPSPDISSLVEPGHPDLQRCIALNEERFSEHALDGVDGVIIDNLMGWYKPEHLQPYLEFLASHGMRHVMVLGNYIQLDRDFTGIITAQGSRSFDYRTLKQTPYIASEFIYDDELRALTARYGFGFISLKDHLCRQNDCPLFIDGHPYTWDKFHFSVEFAGFLAQKIRPTLATTWLEHPQQ